MRVGIIAIAAIGLLAAGCATQAQMQANKIRAGYKETVASFNTCVEAATQPVKTSGLLSHFPLNTREVTTAQMADDTYPTAVEKQEVASFHDAVTKCRNQEAESLSSFAPSVATVIYENNNRSDAITLYLVQGKLTWGQYVVSIKENGTKYTGELQRAERQIDQQLQVDNQAELDRRQRALDSINNSLQQQQMINAINRPVTTSCSRFGSTVNCVSR
jgi:hypothetical protein